MLPSVSEFLSRAMFGSRCRENRHQHLDTDRREIGRVAKSFQDGIGARRHTASKAESWKSRQELLGDRDHDSRRVRDDAKMNEDNFKCSVERRG